MGFEQDVQGCLPQRGDCSSETPKRSAPTQAIIRICPEDLLQGGEDAFSGYLQLCSQGHQQHPTFIRIKLGVGPFFRSCQLPVTVLALPVRDS